MTGIDHSAKTRTLAARALDMVLRAHRALDDALEQTLAGHAVTPRDRAYVQALCFAALRHARSFDGALRALINKAPEPLLRALLLIACADIAVLRTASHAAVGEAVSAAKSLKLTHASGLVNAVLRKFVTQQTTLLAAAKQQSPEARYELPEWLIDELKRAYPQKLETLAQDLQTQAPMWLRVNRQKHPNTALFNQSLAQAGQLFPALPDAIQLAESTPVSSLPGFFDGSCSVQDGAAQLAALLLAPKAGERILDACAAPGGKSAHLLEIAPEAQLLCVDRDARRTLRIEENLQRLGLRAKVLVADAASVTGEFDAILLDAPCTAIGVIRRHPDIGFLRRQTDLAAIVAEQARLLQALWARLKPGGRLLYATCSILPQENVGQMQQFLANHADAQALALPEWFGIEQTVGRQNLPGQNHMDGFYYALLRRKA